MTMTDEQVVNEMVLDDQVEEPAVESVAAVPPSAKYRACSATERRDAFEQLSALCASVQAELCAIAVAADTEGDAMADGLRSPAWVAHHGGLTMRHGRDLLRVAKALETLPALQAALASGTLSWDKVRSATKLAVPETDELIADEARDHSADDIAYLASRVRARTSEDRQRAERLQGLRLRPDASHDGGHVSGWLAGELFARVASVIRQEASRLGPDDNGLWAPLEERQARALDSIVAAYQSGQRDPDRTRLVLRLRDEVLTGEIPGNAELDPSVLTCIDTARRLACCAEVIFQIHTAVGDAIGIRRDLREPTR
jgi:hypothetical protein